MDIKVQRVAFVDMQALRELYRHEAHCQIVHDSILPRGLADPYLILVDGRIGGYGGVWNAHSPGRLMEFYALPPVGHLALPMLRALVTASGATEAEAQTNMPAMLGALHDCAEDVTTEAILFADERTTQLPSGGAVFRRATPEDAAFIFEHHHEPVGDWVVEAGGAIVATGGALHHYNPPYADIFMEVAEPARRKGYGSYLVQELKRACYEAGKAPAARCDPGNTASRATLEKAGFVVCGRLLAGRIRQRSTNHG